MRSPKLLFLTVLAALVVPASASADFGHVVAAGESLSSVAAADGLSVSELAAANGISAGAQLVAGSTLQIPPPEGGDSGSAGSAESSGSSSDSGAVSGSSPESGGGSGSGGGGGYTVQPGDTLSAIAARNGTTVDQLAAANGLDPGETLPAGTQLSVSGQSSDSSSGTEAVSDTSSGSGSSQTSASGGGPQPTAESVSPSDVGDVAAANGVSPSLAEAIANQESGFNNDLVSSTGATGVMQIEPGTWDYIDSALATPPPLSPDSAQDNIRGGVLYLRSLLDRTGGDPSLAAAGYYQGLGSVRAHGMYSDTQKYVDNVKALRQRFGGP
jgi:LysM repeat protein